MQRPQTISTADELVIRICTWNVAEVNPEKLSTRAVKEWVFQTETELIPLQSSSCPLPDVIVIGLQEVDMSALAMIKEKTKRGKEWRSHLHDVICVGTKHAYVNVSNKQLMGLGLFIYAKSAVHAKMRNIETRGARTGFFNSFGNKGAICARFELKGKFFCFINCHLAAHQERVGRRNKDHHRIRNITAFDSSPERLLEHDTVFWFGDLNYRLELSREQVVDSLSLDCKKELMTMHDQLKAAMRKGHAFQGFTEPPITWGPTYKVLKGELGAYSLKRSPAYCDRILYATGLSTEDDSTDTEHDGDRPISPPRELTETTSSGMDELHSRGLGGPVEALGLFECVVCDQWDVHGQARRSGWKCKACIGKKSKNKVRRAKSLRARSMHSVPDLAVEAFTEKGGGGRGGRGGASTPPVPESDFEGKERPAIRCLSYSDDPGLTGSDHRPVHGVFAVAML